MSKLARHLGKLRGYNFADQEDDTQADAIRADPQEHIDALVEGRVLLRINQSSGDPFYAVIQSEPPHEHEWVWTSASWVKCSTCPERFLHTDALAGTPYTGPVPEGL